MRCAEQVSQSASTDVAGSRVLLDSVQRGCGQSIDSGPAMIQGEPANRCSPCRLTGTDPGPAALVNEEEPAGAGLPGTYRDEEAKEGRPLAFSVDRLLGSPDLGRGLKARTWTRGTSPETVPGEKALRITRQQQQFCR